MIKGTIKDYATLITDMNLAGKTITDDFDGFLRKIGGQTVPLTDIDPVSKSFEYTDKSQNLYKRRVNLDMLASYDITGSEDTYYGNCGVMFNVNAPYPHEPKFTWAAIMNGSASQPADAGILPELQSWSFISNFSKEFGIAHTSNTIGFNATGAITSVVPFTGFLAGDSITISGSTSNNGTFAIETIAGDNLSVALVEGLVPEAAGANITITGYTPSINSTGISFNGTTSTITSDVPFDRFNVGETITITGSTLNNGTRTIATIAGDKLSITTVEALTTEAIGANVTITGETLAITSTGISISDVDIITSGTPLVGVNVGDSITITGSTLNNSTFTVETISGDGLTITTAENVADEAAGASVTITNPGPRLTLCPRCRDYHKFEPILNLFA